MKNFLKAFLVFFILLLTVYQPLNAQMYEFTPGKKILQVGPVDSVNELIIFSKFKNISGDSLKLKWKRLNNTIPEKWQPSFCDIDYCYTKVPDSAEIYNYMGVGKESFFKLAATLSTKDSGNITVILFSTPLGKATQIDTCSFTLDSKTTGIEVISKKSLLGLYPNPAKDVLKIETDGRVIKAEFFTSDCRQILKQNLNYNRVSTVDISSLPTGFYLIKLTDASGTTAFDKFVKE